MRTSYHEPNSPFGLTMLNMRSKIGLTQEKLARFLGVSRRAVAEWEAGKSSPKTQHFKAFIELAVKHQVFPAGHETEEIRALWKAARQRSLLDESWLSSLLDTSHPEQSLSLSTQSLQQVTELAPVLGSITNVASMASPAPGPRLDWGDALAVSIFYGREQEMAMLSQWVLEEHLRVVSILGMGGIGKSALIVSLMHELAEDFQVVIFRSLRDTPTLEALLDDCLQVLSPQMLSTLPTTLERRINLLLSHLRQMRVLIVLDNMESLLQEGDVLGHLRPGCEGYRRLLWEIAETEHQSCLLLTSREKIVAARPLEGKHSPVRSLRLAGLSDLACKQLFEEKALFGTQAEQEQLIAAYGGNPLALKIVAETIFDLFAGEIGSFLAQGLMLFGSITDLLDEHFARLAPQEQSILCWLAIAREPITLDELVSMLVPPLPRPRVLEALGGLYRRSLIEHGKHQGSFTLQSVILEYVSAFLIAEGSREIQRQQLDRLIKHGLSQAAAREYVRQTQERLLILPLLTDLQSAYLNGAEVEKQLLGLLAKMRAETKIVQGYGPANLIALLRWLRGNLSGLDLSHLSVRGVYLQGIEMRDASMAGTTLHDAIFTEAFDAIRSVAISSDGKWWAAGTLRGEVRVWREGGQSLHLVWQAHADILGSLAFSPDGRTLATEGYEGAVKLWDLEQGVLLWTGWHTDLVFCVAFSPDGRMLASCGNDAVVRLWDVASGANLQTLSGNGSRLFSLAWSSDGRLLACGSFDGSIRLWHIEDTQTATCIAILTGHTNWVWALAFAPNGKHLVSGSWDNTIKLWEVESSRPPQTLMALAARVATVAWSPDGRVIASAGFDNTISVFDMEQGSYRAALHGHTAVVYDIAFTPDSKSLLSGSEDGTVRVWDITSGQCVRVIEGWATIPHDVAWSPDSTRLASASTDALVTIWDVAGEAQPKVLRGHSWHLFGVMWSPDGQLLASSGRDNAIRLWDPTTGKCRQVLRDPDHVDTIFYGVAWSPDGHLLACGSYIYGVQVWDMVTGTRCWVGQHPTRVRRVAWSPDGKRLASCGDDGNVSLWASSDGTWLGNLQGHSGGVMSIDWSPDGTWLVSGGSGKDGGELFVWDMASPDGEIVQTLKEHPGNVFAVAWSPTGEAVISGGSDGTIRWWEVGGAKCSRIFKGHEDGVWSLRVSPDGRSLASCSNDGTIRVWDLESATLLRTLRHDRPYERLNITGIRGLGEAEIASLRALGAIERDEFDTKPPKSGAKGKASEP